VDSILLFGKQETDVQGFQLHLKIKYSERGIFKIKLIEFQENCNAFKWSLEVKNNWIAVGYSDGVVAKVFQFYYDSSRFDFFLSNRLQLLYDWKVTQSYKLFDQGVVPIQLDALKICKDEGIRVIGDTLRYNQTPNENCFQIPYSSSDREVTEGSIFSVLGLPAFSKIK
jgi:hypothetical protein